MTDSEIATAHGWGLVSVQNKIRRENLTGKRHQQYGKESFERTESDDSAVLVSVHRERKTPKDVLEYGEIDLDIWEIEKQTVNQWEVAMRMADGTAKVVPLWQVKVWLRRKVPKFFQKSSELLLEILRKHSPAAPRPPRKRKAQEHLFEFTCFDAHFGKRCWAEETGENYDTGIARRMFGNAVDDLLDKATARNDIGRILFPIGQDFFNVDNWQDTTVSGTPQDTDTRFPQVFVQGEMAIIEAIEKFLHVAPVDVVYVPGNHDMASSWHLVRAIANRFHTSKHVSVDSSYRLRKFVQWGTVMLMLLHADGEKEADLPGLAATEAPDMWAATTWREAHCGHLHKRSKWRTQDVDEHLGFTVRRLASISGTDKWHYSKGYVGNKRCAEGLLFSRHHGLEDTYTALARE